MHDVADYPDAETLPGLVIYRFDAPLFFANVGDLRRRVQLVVDKEIEAYPDAPPRWLLLNVEANTEVDLTSADGLRELQGDLEAQGIRLGLVRIKRDLYEPLRRAGVIEAIGEDMLFPTLPVAEEAYVLWATTHPPARRPDRRRRLGRPRAPARSRSVTVRVAIRPRHRTRRRLRAWIRPGQRRP